MGVRLEKKKANGNQADVIQIKGDLSQQEINILSNVLIDPVAEDYKINGPLQHPNRHEAVLETNPKAGVADPEGRVTQQAIERALGREIGGVVTGKQYLVPDDVNVKNNSHILPFGNPLITEINKVKHKDWDPNKGMPFNYPDVNLPTPEPFSYKLTKNGDPLTSSTDDETLERTSDERDLALTLKEMRTIKDLLSDEDFLERRKQVGLEDKITDVEIEAIAQTWSEHCCHKKLGAKWYYKSNDSNDEAGINSVTDNPLKSLIAKTTREIDHKDLVSIFEDNAGVVRLDENHIVSHKVETHNSPTGLDPFGGANTGSGGVFRDPTTTGKGMIIVSSQYAFRNPPPGYYKDLPSSIIPPKETLRGEVSGVEDYGNKMGFPTRCGSTFFIPDSLKPTVYVGGVAVAPSEVNGVKTHTKDIKPGYVALSIGGKVGKDGIHGATISSKELGSGDEEQEGVNQSVQIGDPITQKKMFQAQQSMLEEGLLRASQDCGAGGWNSAVGELTELLDDLEEKRFNAKQAFEKESVDKDSSLEERLSVAKQYNVIEDKKASPLNEQIEDEIRSGEIFETDTTGKGGSVVDLSGAPEKYGGLKGWEKLISESQERNVIVVKPEEVERVREIAEQYDVEATRIAEFNGTGDYHVKDQDTTCAFLPIDFLSQGLPQWEINAEWTPPVYEEPKIPAPQDLTDTIFNLIKRPNMQNNDWIYRRFDHEVQGGSYVKPLVGPGEGRSEAISYKPPFIDTDKTLIESWGSNPFQGDIDPYHMGINNVVEAIGRTLAVGGDLEEITFNANITCPKPEKDPQEAAKVLRMVKGACDAEEEFGTPVISGKDSTSMERTYPSTETGEDVHVKAKPEYLMSSLCVKDDYQPITPDFKLPGDVIYVVGETGDELGGSEYYHMHDSIGNNVPETDLKKMNKTFKSIQSANEQQILHSSQYVSRGGLAYALSNSAIGGDIGAEVDLENIDEGVERADTLLMSESTGRFLVSVHPSKQKEFEETMGGCYFRKLGTVSDDKEVNINYSNQNLASLNTDELREANKGEVRL